MLFIVGTILFVQHGFSEKTLILHLVRLFVLTALLVMLPRWGNQVQQILQTSIQAARDTDARRRRAVNRAAHVIESNCFGIPRARDRTDRRSVQTRVRFFATETNSFSQTNNGSPAPPMQLPLTGGDEMLVKGLERSSTKTEANHAAHLSSGQWLRRDQRSLHCAPRPLAGPSPSRAVVAPLLSARARHGRIG